MLNERFMMILPSVDGLHPAALRPSRDPRRSMLPGCARRQAVLSEAPTFANPQRRLLKWQKYGILHAMKTTIDSAGRIVVPKALRQALGLKPGQELEVRAADG